MKRVLAHERSEVSPPRDPEVWNCIQSIREQPSDALLLPYIEIAGDLAIRENDLIQASLRADPVNRFEITTTVLFVHRYFPATP